jgi:hypothetical protein
MPLLATECSCIRCNANVFGNRGAHLSSCCPSEAIRVDRGLPSTSCNQRQMKISMVLQEHCCCQCAHRLQYSFPTCLGSVSKPVGEHRPSTEDGAVLEHPDGGRVGLRNELL